MTFENLTNFRDFGGYKTGDGRRVKRGLLFRSDALCGINEKEQQELFKHLNIKTIIDYRTEAELSTAEKIKTGNTRQFSNLYQEMEKMMRGLAGNEYNRQIFSQMLQLYAAAENAPILLHCKGGKDRTGFGCAVILEVLGVPREKVIEEYLLSNQYKKNEIDQKMQEYRLLTSDEELLDQLRILLMVERDFLEAAFDEAEKLYGNFITFVRAGLNFSDREIEDMRKIYLEN